MACQRKRHCEILCMCVYSFTNFSVVALICLHRWSQAFGPLTADTPHHTYTQRHTNRNAHKVTNCLGPHLKRIRKRWMRRTWVKIVCVCVYILYMVRAWEKGWGNDNCNTGHMIFFVYIPCACCCCCSVSRALLFRIEEILDWTPD